jgi:glycerophosphoryl diester phosphodiesterase
MVLMRASALVLLLAGCAAEPRGPLVDGRTRVLVHQGGRTIGGAERLIALGVEILEMDVRLTRDGHPVILHDATVDRTTDGRGPVAAMTLEELRRLDAGVKAGRPGERIPTVAELLAAVRGRAFVTLELKVAAAAGRTVEAIRAADAFGWTAVRSPDLELLGALKRAEPRLRTGAMGAGPAAVDRLAALGIDACTAGSNAALTREDVARCRAAGIAVWATLCNEEAEMRRLAALGVDGIITDAPELLLRVLRD